MNISADRLKPAFILNDTQPIVTTPQSTTTFAQCLQNPSQTSQSPTQSTQPTQLPAENNSVRSHPPKRISFQADPDFITGEGVDVAAPSLPTLENATSAFVGLYNCSCLNI